MKKIGLIYAKRMRGDIELGDDPATTRSNRLARILGPGKRLLTEQGIYEQSLTQKYKIGSRLAMDDRVFRYCRAGTGLVSSWGAYTFAPFPESAVAAATSAVGATTVTCTAQNTVLVNQFQGGYMMVAVVAIRGHRILSNTAATAGNTFTVTLEDALTEVVTSGATILTLYPGLWNDLRQSLPLGFSYANYIGIPVVAVTTAYYFWLQTWGPTFCVGTTDVGANVNERNLAFNLDGSVIPSDNAGIDLAYGQAGVFWPTSWWDAASHNAVWAMIPLILHCMP